MMYFGIYFLSGKMEGLQKTNCFFISEHFIPKGTLVNAMLFHVMSDPQYWKDPDLFNPERFINNQGKFQRDERVVPYGIGKRHSMLEIT